MAILEDVEADWSITYEQPGDEPAGDDLLILRFHNADKGITPLTIKLNDRKVGRLIDDLNRERRRHTSGVKRAAKRAQATTPPEPEGGWGTAPSTDEVRRMVVATMKEPPVWTPLTEDDLVIAGVLPPKWHNTETGETEEDAEGQTPVQEPLPD